MAGLKWSLGLRNHATGKYLTVESFGFKVNANGNYLKKKQIFFLHSDGDGSVLLESEALRRFVHGDKDGKVHGDGENRNAEYRFTIFPQADGTWALQTAAGYWFHGSGDNISAFTEARLPVPADGKWVVHLAMHPQINMYSPMRKRYVHLVDDHLHTTEDIPWGDDALLTFVFFEDHPCGRYGFMGSNGKYLCEDGSMKSNADAKCQFLLGFHDEKMSFLHESGAYLNAVGGNGILKTQKSGSQLPTKDGLFIIEDSQPQFTIKAENKKYVSNRTSVEVKANQSNCDDDREKFQLSNKDNGKVSFKISNRKFWSCGDNGEVTATAENDDSAATHFTIHWNLDTVKIQANNGKYLLRKPNGSVVAVGKGDSESENFTMNLINRPQICFRGNYGFLAEKGNSGLTECNKPKPEVYSLQSNEDGVYHIKAAGGFWGEKDGNLNQNMDQPMPIYFEFVEHSKFLVKNAAGKYLQGDQNGAMHFNGDGKGVNTLWEY